MDDIEMLRRKDLKAMNDLILASACKKQYFKQLVQDVQTSIQGDAQYISDMLEGMLGTAIWHLAFDEPKADWRRQAEVTLICLGVIGLDLDEFYQLTQEECKTEIQACFLVDTSMKIGADVSSVWDELNELLSKS